MDETALKKLKVQELKNLLSEKGLPQNGKKEELIRRLLESTGNQSEEVKLEHNDEGSSNQHTNEQTNLEVTIPEGSKNEENTNKSNDDAKSPTTSGMSEEEKRIARAKRFGIEVKPANVTAPTDPVKKAAGPAIPKPAKAVISKLGEDEEKLKKRAERFGNVTKTETVEDPASKKPRTETSE